MQIDYLIVGQGIAGTILTHELLEKNTRVVVVDKNPENTCSKASAGICNPITGRRLLKTWKADNIFPQLKSTYKDLEKKLQTKFLSQKAIYRRFPDIETQNQWFARSSEEKWRGYINTQPNNSFYKQFIDNPFGGWETKTSYHINVPLLLEKYKSFLLKNDSYIEDNFKYKDLEVYDKEVVWKGIRAKNIVFCEGTQAQNNPFFNYLPFSPAKGEWLVLNIPEAESLTSIVNQGFFILPLGRGLFGLGATYAWDNLDELPTAEAKAELLAKFDKSFKLKYEKVIDHKVGIRPATQARRPFLGKHYKYKNLFIFNGLGTKGTSLAPYFAKQLVAYSENVNKGKVDTILSSEVNIKRYENLL